MIEFDTEYVKSYDERLGVLSLTGNPKIERMWNDYADNGTGFCVGFRPEIMFTQFVGGGEIVYLDEIPIIKPYPILSYEDQHIFQVYSKQRNWEYEEEYRTHIFSPVPLRPEQRTRVIPPEAYAEIILGYNISDSDKEEIINSIPRELEHIEIRKAELKDGEIII